MGCCGPITIPCSTQAGHVAAELAAQSNGPPGAFIEGQESETRQQLFGRIAPVYDQVHLGRRLHALRMDLIILLENS